MDSIDKTRLYLVWLSCKDFESLKDNGNRKLTELVWKKIKNEMQLYFRGYSLSLQSIIDKFHTLKLTVDPRLPFGYDPQNDSLTYNLWKLFFTLLGDKDYCIPKPALQVAGGLIHEHDHCNFLREHNMIRKSEETQVEFMKKFGNEAEKRAFSSELRFYESCRSILPPYQTYKIKVKKWTKAGKPMQKDFQPISFTKDEFLTVLGSAVKQIDVVRRIESGETYAYFSTDQSIADSQKMKELVPTD